MKINKNELRILVDIDKTLITPCHPDAFHHIRFDYYGAHVYHQPMFNNILLLKAQKARGYEVIAHSANGWAWTEEVINKLGLAGYVDEVATKPLKYMDDKPADEWMARVFVEEP